MKPAFTLSLNLRKTKSKRELQVDFFNEARCKHPQ
jgi:hypothetical protein